MFRSFFKSDSDAPIRACCFHFGRCGSTLLSNMLSSHPEVDWKGELFHDFHQSETHPYDPWKQLDELMCQTGKRVFGFETKFQHLDSNGLDLPVSEFLERLEERDFNRFVVLKRKNYLRQAISVARGQATNRWHYPDSQPAPCAVPVRLDPQLVGLGGKNRPILQCFHFLDASYRDLENELSSRSSIVLSYEEDFQTEPMTGYRRLADFFDIQPQRYPKCGIHRINKGPIRETVVNFEALEKKLRGTPYEWMLS